MRYSYRIIAFILSWLLPWSAFAASTIRDTEIETTLKQLCRPIFEQASLDPDNVRLIIVNDPDVNAFVAGGMNIFVHTGLLAMSDTPDMLQGVIAHETGHIAGGHLARQREEMDNAGIPVAAGYILGIGSALLGAPQAAAALITGGGHVGQRQALAYSRRHEESADQFALQTLDKLHQSPQGLLKLLEYLSNQEYLSLSKPNPYAMTHPLSRARIEHIRNHMEHDGIVYKPLSPALVAEYKRSIVKLKAFLDPTSTTLAAYPASDNSDNARMARAIAYHRQPNITAALQEMNTLLKLHPSDPYYNELKGQIFFEQGKVREALPSYEKASKLLPDAPLLKLQLATIYIATNDPSLLNPAINLLKVVTVKEPNNAMAWYQLGMAYGRQGDMGMSYLALAERAVLLNNKEDMRNFTERAKKLLPAGSPAALRANDISTISLKKR